MRGVFGASLVTTGTPVAETPPTAAPAAASETPPPTEPTEEAAPDSGGTYTHECDYNLDFDNGHTFTAAAFIEDATPGATVLVVATWKQVNGKHVTQSKRVTVLGDGTAEVYFTKRASGANIDRIQALPYDKQCTVTAGLA